MGGGVSLSASSKQEPEHTVNHSVLLAFIQNSSCSLLGHIGFRQYLTRYLFRNDQVALMTKCQVSGERAAGWCSLSPSWCFHCYHSSPRSRILFVHQYVVHMMSKRDVGAPPFAQAFHGAGEGQPARWLKWGLGSGCICAMVLLVNARWFNLPSRGLDCLPYIGYSNASAEIVSDRLLILLFASCLTAVEDIYSVHIRE